MFENSTLAQKSQKAVLCLGVGSVLAFLAGYYKINAMGPIDQWTSCVILMGWAMWFLPGLMDRFNIGLIKDLFIIFFKLWSVDLVYNGYTQLRGYSSGSALTNGLDDGWFFNTSGFMRSAVIVSCLVMSTIAYITKQVQRQRAKRMLLSRLNKK